MTSHQAQNLFQAACSLTSSRTNKGRTEAISSKDLLVVAEEDNYYSIETKLSFIVVDHRSANHENCYCWNLLGSIDRVGLCAAIDWVGGRRRKMGRGCTMPGLICVCSWQSSERSYLSRSDIGTDPSKRMFGSAFLSTLPSYIRPFYNFALPQTTPNHSFRVHFPSSVFDDNGQ